MASDSSSALLCCVLLSSLAALTLTGADVNRLGSVHLKGPKPLPPAVSEWELSSASLQSGRDGPLTSLVPWKESIAAPPSSDAEESGTIRRRFELADQSVHFKNVSVDSKVYGLNIRSINDGPTSMKNLSHQLPLFSVFSSSRMLAKRSSVLSAFKLEEKNTAGQVQDLSVRLSSIARRRPLRITRTSARGRSYRHDRWPRYLENESAPRLLSAPTEQTVSPGTPVSIKCVAGGVPRPRLSWTRDGVSISSSMGTVVGSEGGPGSSVVGHVNISSVGTHDGGLITCMASNSLGTVTTSNRLNVYGPPFVRRSPNVTVVEGEDARLWCPAGGYPPPTIAWSKEGQNLASALRYETLANNSLVIRAAQQQDGGRYSCTASSSHGQTAEGDIVLLVIKPPEIEKFWFPEGQEEGRRSQLTCMVTAGDLPMTVTWLKDGRHVDHDQDRILKQISEYSSVLLFQRLAEHHSGDYTCVAANAAASTNHTAKLTVKVAPRWVMEPRGGKGLVGESLHLPCEARGVPRPHITWRKAAGDEPRNFQPLPVTTTSRMTSGLRAPAFLQAPNGTLHMSSLQKTDAGWYLCQADNGVAAPLANYVKVEVNAGARVVSTGGQVTGHAGQQVSLTCEGSGDPPLSLLWSRDGLPVTADGRLSVQEVTVPGGGASSALRVSSVQSSDGGEYRCTAANEHSSDAAVYTVLVLEPPTAPRDVRIYDLTSRTAQVSWTLHQPSTVLLQYSDSAHIGSWRNVSVPSWSSEHLLTELKAHTAYTVRLLASNQLGTSQATEDQKFTTLEEAPSGAPEGVRVAAAGTGALAVSWRRPPPERSNGALRGFVLTLRQQNLQGESVSITRPLSTELDGKAVSEEYTVRGLDAGTLYEVAVRAFNRAGLGPLSSPRIVRATQYGEPRCPPTSVSCRGTGPSSVRVSWGPPAPHCTILPPPVTGYTITVIPIAYARNQDNGAGAVEMSTTNLEKSISGLRPATNVSVLVRALNDQGSSPPSMSVFCSTMDGVPGAPSSLRGITTGVSSVLVAWGRPSTTWGAVLHYTLYTHVPGQSVKRDLVAASSIDSGWRELTSLQTGVPVQVWVTASTSAGEGPASHRLNLTPAHSSSHPPLTLGGGREWWVASGGGLTLGCRRVGRPVPTLQWVRTDSGGPGAGVGTRGGSEQQLPGGDLHVSDLQSSCNYTCKVLNSEGDDSLTHIIHVTSQPRSPSIVINHATHGSLNLTIHPRQDGGAPILGFYVHYRLPSGSWEDMPVVPNLSSGTNSVSLSALPCGTPVHIYGTAWNQYGISSASDVVVGRTSGNAPPRPDPQSLVEVNDTCVTLRLYVWPERGCHIKGWKVERQLENSQAGEWQIIGSPITRETGDLGLCDFTPGQFYLFKMTATSDAGPTTVLYKVQTGDHQGESFDSSGFVQEVQLSPQGSSSRFFDAPVIAGCISALLLAAAIIICIGVVLTRRKMLFQRHSIIKSNSDTLNSKEKTREEVYASITGTTHKSRKNCAATPIKRSHCRSVNSLGSPNIEESYEIYPYATFSPGGGDTDTIQYGLSFRSHTPASRECQDGAFSRDAAEDTATSDWPETGVSHGVSGLNADARPTMRADTILSRTANKDSGGRETWVQVEGQKQGRNRSRPKSVSENTAMRDSSTESKKISSTLMPDYHVIHQPSTNPKRHHHQHVDDLHQYRHTDEQQYPPDLYRPLHYSHQRCPSSPKQPPIQLPKVQFSQVPQQGELEHCKSQQFKRVPVLTDQTYPAHVDR